MNFVLRFFSTWLAPKIALISPSSYRKVCDPGTKSSKTELEPEKKIFFEQNSTTEHHFL